MAKASAASQVRVGVYIPTGAQLLDTACVDIFAMMGRDYLGLLDMVPKSIVDLAPDVWISYISTTGPGTNIELTGGMKVAATHGIGDAEVQPGRLDILLVPGPDPSQQWGDDVLGFLRGHSEHKGTDILSVCTGIFLCGEAGILGGKQVCGPRALQHMLTKYEGVRPVGHKYRWFQDGNFWSSGGITNGNDLVAAYARTSGRFPRPVAELVCEMAEVGERPKEYQRSQAAIGIKILWLALSSWLMGFGSKKKTA